MPYVKRNEQREIIALSEKSLEGFSELLAQDDPTIVKFIETLSGEQAHMMESDLDFVRVLEDLIDVLVAKNYILFTDLPDIAQEKMRERQVLRGKLSSRLDLFSDDDDDGFF